MKKNLAALLCAGVITVSFAGCTYQDALFNSSGSSQAAQGDAQATTEPEAKAADFEKNLAGLSQYFEKLGINPDYQILYMIAVGYPDEEPAAKPRDLSKIRFVE